MSAADTHYDRLMLLTATVREKGQAQAARELDYSDAAICQVLKGTYKGDVGRILQRVAEVYGTDTVRCPVLGEISLGRCAEEKKRPFSAASPLRVRLWKACKNCTIRREL
jgi:hypothetical protein